MKFHEAVPGGLSVGVPGVLRMLEMAHQTHGKLRGKDCFSRPSKSLKMALKYHRAFTGLQMVIGIQGKFTSSSEYF